MKIWLSNNAIGPATRRALALAITASVTLTAGCAREPDESGPPPLSPAEVKLVAQAPVADKKSFGEGVDVTIFTPTFLFGEARAVGDTMYVTYNTTDTPFKRIATLSHGVLRTVRLSRDYYQVSFENGNRVISAVPPRGSRDWYELRAGSAIPISAPASPVFGLPLHVLADGDSCVEGMDGTTSALDEIRAHHRVSILSQAAISSATNGLMTRVSQAYCDHFNGAEYVTMDAPGVIIRLNGGRATVVTAGRIEAANERHLLLETKSQMIDVDVRPARLP